MSSSHVFISHTTTDDSFVKQLHEALTARGLKVWDDARYLRGGDELWPEVKAAIETAQQFIVLFSQQAFQSEWVYKEVQHAVEIEKQRKAAGDESYRVIALRLDDIDLGAFRWVFGEQRAIVPVSSEPGALAEKMPAILAALSLELPNDASLPEPVEETSVAELLLELRNLKVETEDGKTRAKAEATLTYQPPEAGAREVKSNPFFFTSPLGPIETDDLRWYLEKYYQWPVGQFKERGERIAKQLPEWGKLLYQAALETKSAQEALRGWLDVASKAERRFSVEVSDKLPEGSPPEAITSAKEAATLLLSLPWELLHDERGFLFHGKHAVRVRRRLPNSVKFDEIKRELPIRVLLVSPRPEDDSAAYIDHRVSSKPLVEAIESLGETVSLTILQTPTFPALQQALRREQFDVVHFDGHGVYDPRVGLGKLCFEAPDQDDQLHNRKSELIDADKVATVMRDHRIPLVFLEACQSAKTDDDPTASVAAKLLEQGVVSVVAMTHSVLVETARRFVKEFYRELAMGARIGAAMLAGQQALHADPRRGAIAGAGEFHLQDWFVPVLYQERQDPSLVRQRLSPAALEDVAVRRKFNLGDLPHAPEHSFIGRSRELLALERLLLTEPYAVIRGVGGEGKTTLAVELARWLVRTNRFRRAAFVSLEQYSDAKGMADTIGRQLVGAGYTASLYNDWQAALLPIKRELKDKPTIIVVDNVESLMAGYGAAGYGTGSGSDPVESADATLQANSITPAAVSDSTTSQVYPVATAPGSVPDVFALCQALLDAHPATRIVFTSREPLPKPFANRDRVIPLDRLSREDAVELVSRVMKRREYDEQGNIPADIAELVEAVNRHARALTLLAREVKASGVRATTENLRQLMVRLEKEHPGERENSLYASVELSLRRLPPELREQVKALAVFHSGANRMILRHVLGVEKETAEAIAAALIEVGLAEAMSYGHLRLDPALPNYLLARMDEAELLSLTARWVEAMRALSLFLYRQVFQNAELAFQLARLELPNLLALFERSQSVLTPEEVIHLARNLESILTRLGHSQALVHVIRVREEAARSLDVWSSAQFESLRLNIQRMMAEGRLTEALHAAEQLLDRALVFGESAYTGADYNIALAYLNLGSVLKAAGTLEDAMRHFSEAQLRFQKLTNTLAKHMAAASISETAECLTQLGRLDEAAAAYEESIRHFEKIDDRRWVAVSRGNLATVRLQQKRHDEALRGHQKALDIFETLGEPGSVAIGWHQIGITYRETEQFELAEQAYRQSLAIMMQQQDSAGEALTLIELGNLNYQMGKLKEALPFYRQAVGIYARLQNKRYEGSARNNLAHLLIDLRNYNEARHELLRAIECNKPFGHAAESWKTWNTLHNLEQATGNAQAAAEARGQAMASYLAYRRAGGESQSDVAQLFALVSQAIQQGATMEAERALEELANTDIPLNGKTLVAKLRPILGGNCDPALVTDPNLDYQNAVELQLLLESLGGTPNA